MKNFTSFQRVFRYLKRVFEISYSFIVQINATKNKIPTFLFAAVIFLFVSLYALQRSNSPFIHDSQFYWGLANNFVRDGRFSFINFDNELRGYLFPFLLFNIKSLANLINFDERSMFYLVSSLSFTVLSIYIFPWFVSMLFGWKQHLLGRVFASFFIFFFWRGHFLYPLSDFPALASLLVGITLILKSLRNPPGIMQVILAGLFISAAINIRPIYQVSLFILLLLALISFWKHERKNILRWFGLFAIGFSFVLFPQYQINKTHFQTRSPWVQARYDGDESLYVKQLFWGLGTQKFEANIGDNYPEIIVVYEDPFKLNLQKTNLLKEKTLSQYFKIVQRFPLEIAVSYFRHLFNGLDIFFPTPYVRNIYASHTLLSTVNYLVWFLVISFLMETNLAHLDHQKMLCLLSLLAPVALAIPTAIEVRFFLPVHLLAYGVVGFGIDLVGLFKALMKNKWDLVRFIITGALWLILCFTLSMATIENLVP